MPFEVEMTLTHLANISEYANNYGITIDPIVFFAIVFFYLVGTSYFLAYRLDQHMHTKNELLTVVAILFSASIVLAPLSLTRDPYLLSIFGHGFDGTPKDIYRKTL
jgi:hypothetical protein